MSQLKMYFLPGTPIKEYPLPEGYSYSGFDPAKDVQAWLDCIQPGLCDGMTAEAAYRQEIVNFKDIVPERDIHFLDYKGEHVGTVTSFVFSESGFGDMHMVGIRKDFRGKGLAKYLSYIALKSLEPLHVTVSLTTGEARVAAVKSYLSAGFLPVEYAEGMVDRWEKVLAAYNIDRIQMLNEDGTPYKIIYAAKD